MALNYTTDIMALFASKVGNDPNYQSPGNYGLGSGLTGTIGVASVTVGTAGVYTTVPTATAATGTATFSTRMKLLLGSTIAAAGTGYLPTNVLSVSGGSKTTTAQITLSKVKLISATIGSGGTAYGVSQTFTATVSGGTQTSTAQVSVTCSAGGVVTTINSVSQAGSYSAVPANPAATTGGTGTGLTLILVWGIDTFTVSQAGVYSALPSNPISLTGGAGTGATLTGSWGVDSVVVTSPGVYTVAPGVNFSTGAATATAVLATQTTDDVDTQKMLMMVEIMRSYLAEMNNFAQVKENHEIVRKMMMAMKAGGRVTFSAATMAKSALDNGMLYFARNLKNNASI